MCQINASTGNILWKRRGSQPTDGVLREGFLGVFSSELTHYLLVKVNIWFSIFFFWWYINHNTIGSLVFNTCFLAWKRPTLTVFITVLLLVTLHNTCYQVGKYLFFLPVMHKYTSGCCSHFAWKMKARIHMTLPWGTIQVKLCCGYCLQFKGQVIEPSHHVRRALDHQTREDTRSLLGLRSYAWTCLTLGRHQRRSAVLVVWRTTNVLCAPTPNGAVGEIRRRGWTGERCRWQCSPQSVHLPNRGRAHLEPHLYLWVFSHSQVPIQSYANTLTMVKHFHESDSNVPGVLALPHLNFMNIWA